MAAIFKSKTLSGGCVLLRSNAAGRQHFIHLQSTAVKKFANVS